MAARFFIFFQWELNASLMDTVYHKLPANTRFFCIPLQPCFNLRYFNIFCHSILVFFSALC